MFKENCSQAHLQTYIYTDASSKEGCVGMAIICDKTTIKWKLSNNYSIYTSESLAILKAIEYTISNVNDNNINIFSDFLSTITSTQNDYFPSDIAKKMQNAHFMIKI
jgi:hypothetical protein